MYSLLENFDILFFDNRNRSNDGAYQT